MEAMKVLGIKIEITVTMGESFVKYLLLTSQSEC